MEVLEELLGVMLRDLDRFLASVPYWDVKIVALIVVSYTVLYTLAWVFRRLSGMSSNWKSWKL